MGISLYSTSASSNNSAPPNGAPEGMAPSTLNDTLRQIMADIRSWYEGAQWIDFGHTPTKVDSDTFTVSGDQTATYEAGRRIKFTGSVSGYATIASTSYSAPNTTVNITTTAFSGTLTAVAVGILSASNNAIPQFSGTFTGTLTGMTAATTGTVNYSSDGALGVLHSQSSFTGISNTTSLTMTGLPAAMTPVHAVRVPVIVVSNGNTCTAEAIIAAGATTITFQIIDSSGGITLFQNSGSKGLPLGFAMFYPLV